MAAVNNDPKPARVNSAIPAPYRQLAPSFDLLSADMARVVGGLLAGFTDLPDAMIERIDDRSGEFIGYSGITNRGRTDHLLLSEWALQSIYPAEFVRRFAEGEALYSQREFHHDGRRTVYAVMVSCGPQSLGHGRFVALGSLFHLAMQAQKQDAEFYWCALMPGDDAKRTIWHCGLTRKSLRDLVTGASTTEPDEAAIDHAMQRFGDTIASQLEPDVRIANWAISPQRDLLGGQALLPARTAYALSYDYAEGTDVARPAMRLRLMRAGRSMTARTLVLPEPEICLAALRRPFKPSPQSTARGKQTSLPARNLVTKIWEQQQWMFAPHNLAVVKIENTVIVVNRKGTAVNSFALERGDKLVGLNVSKRALQYITYNHSARDGSLKVFERRGGDGITPGEITTLMVSDAGIRHLLRRYTPLSLPNMSFCSSSHSRFFSASGGSYHLWKQEDAGAQFATFKSQPGAGSVIHSDGLYSLNFPDRGNSSSFLTVAGWSDQRVIMKLPFAIVEQMPSQGQPRAILISPSTRTVSICVDGRKWWVYSVLPAHVSGPPPPSATAELSQKCAVDFKPNERVLSLETAKGGVRAIVWVSGETFGQGTLMRVYFRQDKRQEKTLVSLQELEARYANVRCDPRDGAVWAVRLADEGNDLPAALERIYTPRDKTGQNAPGSISIAKILDEV